MKDKALQASPEASPQSHPSCDASRKAPLPALAQGPEADELAQEIALSLRLLYRRGCIGIGDVSTHCKRVKDVDVFGSRA